MNRLFIAIKVNTTEEISHHIALLQENLSANNINWIRQDHYHITLKFLGRTPEKIIPDLSDELRNIAASIHAFPMTISKLGMFGSRYKPRVLWLAIDDAVSINRLHIQLQKRLRGLGFSDHGGNFIPHLSIARIRKVQDVVFFHQVIIQSINWGSSTQNVDEIVLYNSILGAKGAEYQLLGRFPLAK